MSDHAASPTIVPITDDLAADLLGDCDICDAPHVYAMVGSIAVCDNEQCAAEALRTYAGHVPDDGRNVVTSLPRLG